MILLLLCLRFTLKAQDGRILQLTTGDNTLFIPPKPLTDILQWQGRVSIYTLNNVTGYCPPDLHTTIVLDEKGNKFKSCNLPRQALHLAFSTGSMNLIRMPRSVSTTEDLVVYLRSKGYITV